MTLGAIHAQTNALEYQQRLYYTCKVWGYAKYYHQNLGTENINWDAALLNTLDEIKSATSSQMFNQALVNMLELAGDFETPTGTLPEVPSSLRRNIDLTWFADPQIKPDLSDLLLRVEEHFRPGEHWLLGKAEVGPQISLYPTIVTRAFISGYWPNWAMVLRNPIREKW